MASQHSTVTKNNFDGICQDTYGKLKRCLRNTQAPSRNSRQNWRSTICIASIATLSLLVLLWIQRDSISIIQFLQHVLLSFGFALFYGFILALIIPEALPAFSVNNGTFSMEYWSRVVKRFIDLNYGNSDLYQSS